MEKEYKPPLDRILEELNRLNPGFPSSLTSDSVQITSPALFTGPGGLTNTRATLALKAGVLDRQYFSGTTLIYYNRLSIARLLLGFKIPGRNTDYANSQAAMTALKAKYQLQISSTDISLVATTNPASLQFITRSDSIGYTGTITLPYEITA